MNTLATWTPTTGETVHLRPGNRFHLAAGRYLIEKQAGEFNGSFNLRGITVSGWASAAAATLREQERGGLLTPIDPATVERDKQMAALWAQSPLRAAKRRAIVQQHDASDLALFRAASESELAL